MHVRHSPYSSLVKILNRGNVFSKSFFTKFIDGCLTGFPILVQLVEEFDSRPDFGAEQISSCLRGFYEGGEGNVRRPFISFPMEILNLVQYFLDFQACQRQELGRP